MRIPIGIPALALSFALPALAGEGAIGGRVTAASDADRPWVVYVEKGPPAAPAPPPAQAKEMVQKDQQFQPGVLWVDSGAAVDFVNLDNIYHNVFSPSPGHDFDLGLYRGGVKKSVRMSQPGEMDVYCNIHPGMRAKILVVPPQHAEVAADGSYALPKMPPGTYTVVAWGAAHEPVRKQVELRPGETARLDFALEPRKSLSGVHLNKNGEQYGRYK